jgi:hypothetical protein
MRSAVAFFALSLCRTVSGFEEVYTLDARSYDKVKGPDRCGLRNLTHAQT